MCLGSFPYILYPIQIRAIHYERMCRCVCDNDDYYVFGCPNTIIIIMSMTAIIVKYDRIYMA